MDNLGSDGRLLSTQGADGSFTLSQFVVTEGIPVTQDVVHIASSNRFVNITNGSVLRDDVPAGVLRAVPVAAVVMFCAAGIVIASGKRS